MIDPTVIKYNLYDLHVLVISTCSSWSAKVFHKNLKLVMTKDFWQFLKNFNAFCLRKLNNLLTPPIFNALFQIPQAVSAADLSKVARIWPRCIADFYRTSVWMVVRSQRGSCFFFVSLFGFNYLKLMSRTQFGPLVLLAQWVVAFVKTGIPVQTAETAVFQCSIGGVLIYRCPADFRNRAFASPIVSKVIIEIHQ